MKSPAPSRAVHAWFTPRILSLGMLCLLTAVVGIASQISRADDESLAYVEDPLAAGNFDLDHRVTSRHTPSGNVTSGRMTSGNVTSESITSGGITSGGGRMTSGGGSVAFGKWTNSNCNGCHTTESLYSHPVNVTPSMTVPKNLPLTHGQVTCTTCHDNSTAAAHMQARRTHRPLLRPHTVTNFCVQCHNPADVSRTAMHGATLGKAHLRQPNYVKRFSPTSPTRTAGTSAFDDSVMDNASQRCLTCHDGSFASDVSTGTSTSLFAALGQMKDHPMGMAYPNRPQIVTSSGGLAPFRPRVMLDSRITLVDGKIGCLSCHSPYSREKDLLVMSNTRSQLCLACHAEN